MGEGEDVAGRATIETVARHSGVSTATVSRVMQDGTGFSAATRERVLAAAAELSWVPNGAARSLAVRRAGIIGLLFPDLGQSGAAEDESPLYVDQVIRGAERVATLAGEAILIAATRPAAGPRLASSVVSKVDGLVVMDRSLSERDIATFSRSVPIVVLAQPRGRRGLDSVGTDGRGGALQITKHLLESHGYRELAFVAGPARSPDSMERFAGFCEALGAAGLPVPAAPAAEGDFTEAGGARAMRQLLGSPPWPRAIVFGNDEMAIGALGVLDVAKVRVPDQIALTGFDDIVTCRHVRPALTTVHQPMRALGEEAVRVMLERLRHPSTPHEAIVLRTDIVVRRSCGCRPRGTSRRETRN